MSSFLNKSECLDEAQYHFKLSHFGLLKFKVISEEYLKFCCQSNQHLKKKHFEYVETRFSNLICIQKSEIICCAVQGFLFDLLLCPVNGYELSENSSLQICSSSWLFRQPQSSTVYLKPILIISNLETHQNLAGHLTQEASDGKDVDVVLTMIE